MENKFTPGPWVVHPIKATVDGSAKSGIYPICAMLWPTNERSESETEANARLIAAAPDMYEALKRISEMSNEDGDNGEHRYAARAAIAKAEGRE